MKKVAITDMYETITLYPSRIIGVGADDSYSYLFITDVAHKNGWRMITSTQTMKHYENLLREDNIIRTNKSQLVSIAFVEVIDKNNMIKLSIDCMGSIPLNQPYSEAFYLCFKF